MRFPARMQVLLGRIAPPPYLKAPASSTTAASAISSTGTNGVLMGTASTVRSIYARFPSGRSASALISSAGSAFLLSTPMLQPALCWGLSPAPAPEEVVVEEQDDVPGWITEFMDNGPPAQISFGFGIGFCLGFASRKALKGTLVGTGLAYGSVKWLDGNDYVAIKSTKIEGDALALMDFNKNGEIDEEDMKEVLQRALKVLFLHPPNTASGFLAGALIGAKCG